MDYETPDGSQFSLREVWRDSSTGNGDESGFSYTTVSATVDGRAYFGRLERPAEEVDEGDVLSSLQLVPPEAIYPAFEDGLTEALTTDPAKHYLKAPSFTWDDCQPGMTFVADCMLHEARVLERLGPYRHPNVIRYHGCEVKDGRITYLCLEKAQSNLVDYVERGRNKINVSELLQDVEAGVKFLHSLSLAHNDINPENICIVADRAVIVDFDSCMPFGESLVKGVSFTSDKDGCPLSVAENDQEGLRDLRDFLEGFGRTASGRSLE